MPFTLHHHPAVRDKDLPLIDLKAKDRIRKAIEARLQTAPQYYGKPLRKSLKGYRKPRVGDFRVVFKVIESGGMDSWHQASEIDQHGYREE